MAGAPGFEPGNGGIKIQVVRVIYQRPFRKIAEIPALLDQQVGINFGMPNRLPWTASWRDRSSNGGPLHRITHYGRRGILLLETAA